MQVSSSSWHYRVWQFTHENPEKAKPTNLCRYFWRIFFTITIPACIVGLALAGVAWLIYLFATHPWALVWTILGVGLFVAVCYSGYRYDLREKRLKEERRLLPPEPPKEPGLVRSFLKAKKQKMCPLITVVEKE